VTQAIAANADLTGTSRWTRGGRIDGFDGVGEGDVTFQPWLMKESEGLYW